MIAIAMASLLLTAPPDISAWTLDGPGRLAPGAHGFAHIVYDSPQHTPMRLVAPAPVDLPDDLTFLNLWCARLAGDFDLTFVIVDAKGTEHIGKVQSGGPTFPEVRRRHMADWSVWRPIESVFLALPAPVEERVTPESRKQAEQTIWPRPLRLAAIQVAPVKQRRDNEAHEEVEAIAAGRGELWLTELRWDTIDGHQAKYNAWLFDRTRWVRDAPLRLFADDLTRSSGPMTYRVELREGYLGSPLWRVEGETTIDRRAADALFADRVELPALGQGRYWLETTTWRNGVVDRQRQMQLFVIRGPVVEIKPVPPRLRIDGEHVLPTGTSVAPLKLAGPLPDGTEQVRLQVVDWRHEPVIDVALPRGDWPPQLNVPVTSGTDYYATAECLKGGQVIERVGLHFGVASPPPEDKSIPKVPSRDQLLRSKQPVVLAEHFGALMDTYFDDELLTRETLKQFDTWVGRIASTGARQASFMFGWGQVEPLPGVYRWDEIERRVRLLEAAGLDVFLTPTLWADTLEEPRWFAVEPVLDQHGQVMGKSASSDWDQTFYGDRYREAHAQWLTAVAARFRGDPAVIGYRIKPANGSGANQPEFLRTDSSPANQMQFKLWLGAGLHDLVDIPKLFVLTPYSPARSGPDLSRRWEHYLQFRVDTYRRSVDDILKAFAAADPVRQVHLYRSSQPTAWEACFDLLGDRGEFHDEGGPQYFQRAMDSMAYQAGVPYTNEGHQFTPPSIAMVDSGFFYDSIYDDGWCWLYRWSADRDKDPRFKALPDVLKFIGASQPALREWVANDGLPPQVLVYGSRLDGWCNSGGRNGFYSDIAGVDVFTALFSYHQLPAHFADEWTMPDRIRTDAKLVFAVGDAMADAAVGALGDYARQGGKLALVGNAGQYQTGDGARNRLAKALAGLPNVRHLAAPDQPAPAPGEAIHARGAFKAAELQALLDWAGVTREISVAEDGFEPLLKLNPNGTRYAGIFRRWPGSYDNIWYDEQVAKQWGTAAATVTLHDVPDGSYRITRFHRTARPAVTAVAKGGKLTFRTPEALVAELQLFRIEAVTP